MIIGRMRRIVALTAALIGTVFSCGCTDLPDLELDVCGNYVVDEAQGEDCDSHADSPYVCAKPGEVNACHFTCFSGSDLCPGGFGCGQDGVCRRALGQWVVAGEPESFSWPTAIRAGDFDSDGNGDLLLLGVADFLGHRPARVLFSEGFSLRQGLTILPSELANPAVGAGAGDKTLRDIAFSDFEGVALLRGYIDRTADFLVFPTISVPNGAHVRINMAEVLPQRPGDEIVVFMEQEDGAPELRGIEFSKTGQTLATLPGGEDELVGPQSFFSARFDETLPCEQVVLGYRDATSVYLFTTCRDAGGLYVWNTNGSLQSIALQPPANIDRGVIATDLDVDGHMDLLIGAGGMTYAAFGLGTGQFTSQKSGGNPNEAAPYALPLMAGAGLRFPLAVADLNTDGRADFVMENGIVLSNSTDYSFAYRNLGAPWSEAIIGNFNANNWLDVVSIAEGALDIHFFNNAGNGMFGAATLPTEGLPAQLNIGDFDGDLLGDLVFSESISERSELSAHVSFAFGSAFGPPAFPIATGEVGDLGQLVTGNIVGATGADPMTEVGVIAEGKDGAPDSFALLPGRASRAIYSTVPLALDDESYLPVSLAFGRFGDATSDIVALGAEPTQGRLRLFRIEAFDEEGLVLPQPSDPLPANYMPSGNASNMSLRYGATVIPVDMDRDEFDEALIVGAFDDSEHAAFTLTKYDAMTEKFGVVGTQSFEAYVSIDSTIFADDLDGDGMQDIVLTTGTHGSPSQLIVVWGDGSGHLPDLKVSLERLVLDGLGVRAVVAVRSPLGKGKMLIASTTKATYTLQLSEGRTWATTKIDEIGPARALAAIDFDRDGVEDLAVQLDEGLKLFRSVPK